MTKLIAQILTEPFMLFYYKLGCGTVLTNSKSQNM